MFQIFSLFLLFSLVGPVFATNNGLAIVPAMGYNTWNDFRCNITARDIIEVADAMVKQGLDKLGYIYVNIDDCWAKGRYPNGTVFPDPERFPNGMKAVGDYIHSKGMKFGIYTDRGKHTCQGRPGSYGFEEQDANTYAEWGVDYVKEDSCSATQNHAIAFEEYGKMRDALNATGRPIYFSLCGWHSWYAPVGWELGNSWRIAQDCNTWGDVLVALDTNAPLYKFARPGGWNDPDMLIGSSSSTAAFLTPRRSRSMFTLWAIMNAPLLIGSNIRNLSEWDLETFSNAEIIAANQDSLGIQGRRLVGGNLTSSSSPSKTNVWGKPLSDGSWAVAFLNNGDEDTNIVCDEECLKSMGFSSTVTLKPRDLWQHKDLPNFSGSFIAQNVEKQGGSKAYKFIPVK